MIMMKIPCLVLLSLFILATPAFCSPCMHCRNKEECDRCRNEVNARREERQRISDLIQKSLVFKIPQKTMKVSPGEIFEIPVTLKNNGNEPFTLFLIRPCAENQWAALPSHVKISRSHCKNNGKGPFGFEKVSLEPGSTYFVRLKAEIKNLKGDSTFPCKLRFSNWLTPTLWTQPFQIEVKGNHN